MDHSRWDEELARDAGRISQEVEIWFPFSHEDLRSRLFSQLAREMEQLRVGLDSTGRRASFLRSLVPPAIRSDLSIEEVETYAYSTYAAVPFCEIRLKLMEPGFDPGKVVLGLGMMTFAREHLVQALMESRWSGPLTVRLAKDLSERRHRTLWEAFCRGGVLVPPDLEGAGRIVIFQTGGDGSPRMEVSGAQLSVSLRVAFGFLLFMSLYPLAGESLAGGAST